MIYMIYDIKSLLTRGLEKFYLSLENYNTRYKMRFYLTREFFHNNLYLILYNKKFIIYLFIKHFY